MQQPVAVPGALNMTKVVMLLNVRLVEEGVKSLFSTRRKGVAFGHVDLGFFFNS
jgi:hypothetical protein